MDAKFIDAFLRKTYEGYPEAAQELCIITTKDASAYQIDESAPSPEEARQRALVRTQGGGPMKTPSRPPWSEDVKSVFRSHTPREVAKGIRESFAGTKLEIDYCAILDENSLQDSTAIIARTKPAQSEDVPGFATVRQSFEEVNAAIGAWSIGEGSLEEALEEGAPAR
ncbi:hypothetical protein KC363_g7942 [Hortaea werneckii]|nr:hypothetical protein KC363_g7942 [Hortaea werneckii]